MVEDLVGERTVEEPVSEVVHLPAVVIAEAEVLPHPSLFYHHKLILTSLKTTYLYKTESKYQCTLNLLMNFRIFQIWNLRGTSQWLNLTDSTSK